MLALQFKRLMKDGRAASVSDIVLYDCWNRMLSLAMCNFIEGQLNTDNVLVDDEYDWSQLIRLKNEHLSLQEQAQLEKTVLRRIRQHVVPLLALCESDTHPVPDQ